MHGVQKSQYVIIMPISSKATLASSRDCWPTRACGPDPPKLVWLGTNALLVGSAAGTSSVVVTCDGVWTAADNTFPVSGLWPFLRYTHASNLLSWETERILTASGTEREPAV